MLVLSCTYCVPAPCEKRLMQVMAFSWFVFLLLWPHKTLNCHSLEWFSVCMMNGSVTQFPDGKSEVEKEQELDRGHWVTILELGRVLGSGRDGFTLCLSLP